MLLLIFSSVKLVTSVQVSASSLHSCTGIAKAQTLSRITGGYSHLLWSAVWPSWRRGWILTCVDKPAAKLKLISLVTQSVRGSGRVFPRSYPGYQERKRVSYCELVCAQPLPKINGKEGLVTYGNIPVIQFFSVQNSRLPMKLQNS